ncbi:MAG: homocysteine S-methyltransferase family protein [Acetivibrionales bacterium]|jgi:5-methyltetrahydrofolate--homocysteine methyltransferase
MNRFIKEVEKRILVYDGSKGYLLQKMGLAGGDCPELWNIKQAVKIKEIYMAYKDAGCDVIQTNTFQGNRVQLEKYSLGSMVYELNYQGAVLAKEVMGDNGFVAASVGPMGELLEPLGELTFKKAYEIYKEQVTALVDGGVDIINFETFSDLAEMRAAFFAAKEVSDIPVICSFAFESNGRTLMGTDPFTAAVVMKALGAEMIGANCSFGPDHMLGVIKKMHEAGGICLSVKPNAGIPEAVGGSIVYKETVENFTKLAQEFARHGARLIGGCCGTTPDYIKALRERVEGMEVPCLPEYRGNALITSTVSCYDISNFPDANIGEINSDKDSNLIEALNGDDTECIADMAMNLQGEEFDLIYINIDTAMKDSRILGELVKNVQAYVKQPLVIETKYPDALDYALNAYNGRAGVIIKASSGENRKLLTETAEKYGSAIIKAGI